MYLNREGELKVGTIAERPNIQGSGGHEDHADWHLVSRIIGGRTFERAERLRAFLLFVTEKSLLGRDAEITEQNIGIEVFARAPGYNPGDDSIVRSHARLLRQRLTVYYEQEGAGDTRRVTIPKGAYVPCFEDLPNSHPVSSRQPEASPEPEGSLAYGPAPVGAPETVVDWGRRSLLRLAPFGIVAAASAVAGFYVARPSPKVPQGHPFWSLMFERQRQTLFVAGDTGLVMLSNLLERPVTLEEYLTRTYRNQVRNTQTAKATLIDELARRRYTAMIDMQLLARIQPFARDSQDFRVRYARDVQLQDLKESNVILCGAHEANPWTEVFRERVNFRVLRAPGVKHLQLSNRVPRLGEQALYQSQSDGPDRKVYGHIAYLPDSGGSARALVIEGTGSAGTEAAADFILSDGPFRLFLNRIRRPNGDVPGFELVVATDLIYEGKAPKSELIAERVY